MNKNALQCTSYQISRDVNEPVTLYARFVLPMSPSDNKEIAEAIKKIELLLGGSAGINLVQGAGRPRCQWCGVLHNDCEKVCTQCGGAL